MLVFFSYFISDIFMCALFEPACKIMLIQRFAYITEHEIFSLQVWVDAIPEQEVRPSSAVTTVTHYSSRRDLQNGPLLWPSPSI